MHLPKSIVRFASLLLLSLCLSCNCVQGQSILIRQEQQKLLSIRDSISIVNSLNRIGLLYYMKNPDSCFYYGITARAIAARLHYPKGEADAENLIAIAFYFKGLYREALGLFSKILVSYQSHNDTAGVAQTLSNMAAVYTTIADTTQAKLFSQRAVEAGNKLKQDSLMSVVYISYCIRNPTLGSDSVRYYMDKSREIAERYKDNQMLLLITQAQADRLLRTGHRAEALPLIRQSLAQSHNEGMEYFEINALTLYGDYYAGQPDSVIYYYSLVYKLIRTNGYTFYQIPILKVILANTLLTGDKDRIIAVQHQLEEARAAENENLKKFIGDYVNYNNVASHNELLETRNKNNKIKIWLLTGFCSAAALLIIFVYRLYRLSRKSNRQIQRALNALEQSQQETSRIIKIVAHDLKSPVTAISYLSTSLLKSEQTEENMETLLLIKEACSSSLSLIKDLLIEKGAFLSNNDENTDIGKLLRYCVLILQPKADEKNLSLNLKVEEVVIKLNSQKMWRVISNVLDNAIKFSPEYETIDIELEKKQHSVLISISDNGIGIPESLQESVFSNPAVAGRPGATGEPSYGLGLSISQQIIKEYQGRIWFEGKKNGGTSFFIELPFQN